MTQTELSTKLKESGEDRGRSAVAQWERDDSTPPLPVIVALASILKTTPQYLAFGVTTEPVVVPPDPEALGYVLVDEVTFEDSGTPVTSQQWGLPTSWLRRELGIVDSAQSVVVQSPSDTEKFGYGDRLLVDRGSRKVSPPGYFLHWDGQGAVVSYMTLVPSATKTQSVRIKGALGDYDLSVDKVQVIGRVMGVWNKV